MTIPADYLIPSLDSLMSINGQACVHHVDLMQLVDCRALDEFEEKYINPTEEALTKRGKIYENHIIEIYTKVPETKNFYFSALAVYCFTMIVVNMQPANKDDIWEVHGSYSYSKYKDTSFFVSPDSDRRDLRVGDKVEILKGNPDVVFPTTAMISYAKK